MLFMEVIQMDLVQIGKFIAELRKEQELTQEQILKIILHRHHLSLLPNTMKSA